MKGTWVGCLVPPSSMCPFLVVRFICQVANSILFKLAAIFMAEVHLFTYLLRFALDFR